MKKISFLLISISLFLGLASGASAYVAASTNYRLEKDSINTGGTELSSSASYLVSDTVGEVSSGVGDGSTNDTGLGYRFMEFIASIVTPVSGCTDSTATNYNSSATVDDGSCTYSTGSTGTTVIPPPTPPLPPVPVVEPIFTPTPPPGVTPEVGEAPFVYLPVSTTTPDLEWKLFFVQPKENAKTFDWRGTVRLSGEKPLTIVFNTNLSADFLKTIGVTLTDPEDESRTFSFLMHRSAKGSYEATLSPLVRAGTYPIDIYVINYKTKAVTKGAKLKNMTGSFYLGAY